MKPTIYILLPVHNRRAITERFVKCLKVQTYTDYHLILIDDGSADGTEEMVRSEIEALTVITGSGDWWWAGSLQQGYRWLKANASSTSDLVLIINDDTEFEPYFLERAIALMGDKRGTLLLAQCYNLHDRQLFDAGVYVDWRNLTFAQATTVETINCLSTRGLFLRVADFFRIGGFHPRVLPHYLSDYEFTIRAHHKGMQLSTDPSLMLWMDETATGYAQIEPEPFVPFIRKYFSKKSSTNPLFWTVFILLACPWPWKVLSLLHVWGSALRKICSSIIYSIKGSRVVA